MKSIISTLLVAAAMAINLDSETETETDAQFWWFDKEAFDRWSSTMTFVPP